MRYIQLIILLNIGFILKAQINKFTVDCGNDTSFCYVLNDTIPHHIGTKVKIANGIPPIKYSWACKVFYIDHYLTASDFLSDTAILTPTVGNWSTIHHVLFYLRVTDSIGNKATDSIKINFSSFIYGLTSYSYTIYEGDSIWFGDIEIGGGLPPVKYYWTPSTGVFDSTSITTWFKPVKTIWYYQYAIDSAGCRSPELNVLDITVNPTLVESVNNKLFSLHQEGSKLVFNNSQNKLARISFFTLDGKNIATLETMGTTIDTQNLFDKSSIYLCILNINGRQESCKYINNSR